MAQDGAAAGCFIMPCIKAHITSMSSRRALDEQCAYKLMVVIEEPPKAKEDHQNGPQRCPRCDQEHPSLSNIEIAPFMTIKSAARETWKYESSM
jgi:hypothetical protein